MSRLLPDLRGGIRAKSGGPRPKQKIRRLAAEAGRCPAEPCQALPKKTNNTGTRELRHPRLPWKLPEQAMHSHSVRVYPYLGLPHEEAIIT
ncbi:hypothetical protein RRF57_010029 [Xylaria bambusicola]|uniref:Uncharacterized protein n=1 Tax=Xylaria bambusicola TaxID=326684 RepID=A0AAN7UKL0_9PEZI